MLSVEAKLKNMTNTVKALNSLLSVIQETESNGEVYLVVEHEDYGHITELHAEDYPHHKEILRDALEFATSNYDKEALPWD
jgi:hypothetical protein